MGKGGMAIVVRASVSFKEKVACYVCEWSQSGCVIKEGIALRTCKPVMRAGEGSKMTSHHMGKMVEGGEQALA